jgi:hypothetical protein
MKIDENLLEKSKSDDDLFYFSSIFTPLGRAGDFHLLRY